MWLRSLAELADEFSDKTIEKSDQVIVLALIRGTYDCKWKQTFRLQILLWDDSQCKRNICLRIFGKRADEKLHFLMPIGSIVLLNQVRVLHSLSHNHKITLSASIAAFFSEEWSIIDHSPFILSMIRDHNLFSKKFMALQSLRTRVIDLRRATEFDQIVSRKSDFAELFADRIHRLFAIDVCLKVDDVFCDGNKAILYDCNEQCALLDLHCTVGKDGRIDVNIKNSLLLAIKNCLTPHGSIHCSLFGVMMRRFCHHGIRVLGLCNSSSINFLGAPEARSLRSSGVCIALSSSSNPIAWKVRGVQFCSFIAIQWFATCYHEVVMLKIVDEKCNPTSSEILIL